MGTSWILYYAGQRNYRPNELCKKFLGLKPRPTIKQLKYVLEPLGSEAREIVRKHFNSSHSYREWLEKNRPESTSSMRILCNWKPKNEGNTWSS